MARARFAFPIPEALFGRSQCVRSYLNGAGRRLRLPARQAPRGDFESRPGLYGSSIWSTTSITAATGCIVPAAADGIRSGPAHLMATAFPTAYSARQLEDRLGITYKTAWLLDAEVATIDGRSDQSNHSERSSKVIRRKLPFREGDYSSSRQCRQILVIGAVKVIDRDINQAKPRRKHADYLGTLLAASALPWSPRFRQVDPSL